MPSRADYLASLPRKRVTAAALIRDEAGRVLLVEPTYRPDWLLPGGTVEPHEAPAQAAAREVLEELGSPLTLGRALAMQWLRKEDDPHGVLHFAYDGGVVERPTIDRFRLPADELASYRFVPVEAVQDLANTETTNHILAAIEATRTGNLVELDR